MKVNSGIEKNDVELPCKKLLIGVTGSVGAVALPQYIRTLRLIFAREIQVIMSFSAKKFVKPYTIGLMSGNHVFTDTFDQYEPISVPHIELTRDIDIFLIIPATANVIGKAAHGICDDLITTSIIACQAPIVFVPSMNEVMWTNRVVQENVKKIRSYGYHVIDPTNGYEVSTMKRVNGAMPSLSQIIKYYSFAI